MSRGIERKVICVGIRHKYVGKETFESDIDAGNFCRERFWSFKAAMQFVVENEKRIAFLKTGSHCPYDPSYLRWSETQIEFYQTEYKYAWHRLDYRKHGERIYQMNFRTAFYTDAEKSTDDASMREAQMRLEEAL